MTDLSLTLERAREFTDTELFRTRDEQYRKKHPIWPGYVGIELEGMVFHREPAAGPRPATALEINPILERLAAKKGWHPQAYRTIEGQEALLKIDLEREDQISFEPGAQVEFSSKPYPCLLDAHRRLMQIRGMLTSAFCEEDLDLLYTGLNPWNSLAEIGLQLRKSRYLAMDRYFQSLGEFGQRMMRQTSTIQINLDFGDHDSTLVRRYLVSNILSPFSTAIFAYSPFVQGKLTEHKSYRGYIWQKVDPARTGYPDFSRLASSPQKSEIVDLYLQHLLEAPVVFVEQKDYAVPNRPFSFRSWMSAGYEGIFPTLEDFKTHATLHFPDVRAKGFIELRAVDCQAPVWQTVVGEFFVGLLYDERNLDHILSKYAHILGKLPALQRQASLGMNENEIFTIAKELFRLSIEGFKRLPACFQEDVMSNRLQRFYTSFTERGRTPADDLIDFTKKDGALSLTTFKKLEEYWLSLLK